MQNERGFKNRLGITDEEVSGGDPDLKSLYSELSEFEQRIQKLEEIGKKRAAVYGVIGMTTGLVIGMAAVYISYYIWMDIVDITKRAEERDNNIHVESFLQAVKGQRASSSAFIGDIGTSSEENKIEN